VDPPSCLGSIVKQLPPKYRLRVPQIGLSMNKPEIEKIQGAVRVPARLLLLSPAGTAALCRKASAIRENRCGAFLFPHRSH
jgi:hypothetical protein